MDSCITSSGHGENLQAEGYSTTIIPTGKRPSSRRTYSSCSSSTSRSFSSSSFDDSLQSNSTTPLSFSGIPFSWEQQPGIPKKYLNPYSPSKPKYLPLPPNPTPSTRSNLESTFSTQKKNENPDTCFIDPFVAALVECSRDRRREDLWKRSSKGSRTLNDRFGFINIYFSCKNSCTVSDSTVIIPRSIRGRTGGWV